MYPGRLQVSDISIFLVSNKPGLKNEQLSPSWFFSYPFLPFDPSAWVGPVARENEARKPSWEDRHGWSAEHPTNPPSSVSTDLFTRVGHAKTLRGGKFEEGIYGVRLDL